MSEKGSVFQKGGGGTNFEQNIQTAFLVTMLIGGDVPYLPSSRISEIALQVTNRGYETDDLLVVAKSEDGEHRILIQIKHEIAFTEKNELCKEVFSTFWKDYNNTFAFNKEKDKLIVIKSGLTKSERNHLKSILNWANTHSTATDFISEVNRIKAKKEQLDVFRKILKEANNNVELTDETLWEFLKCVDVLEYDFLDEGSTCKTYFLNLIKLCKNGSSALNEEEIWNCVYSYVSSINPNGGSVTLESVKEQSFYKHFDLTLISPYSTALKKIQNDSQAILRPIRTTIGFGKNEIHFPRTELIENILDSIKNTQFTIVIGKPGVGKTAVVKDLLKKDFSNASVFVFRADQFNVSALANVLSNIGINESIDDIFSCVSLIPEKIVFIDSFEKLLESDPECAFKQFLAMIKDHPDIKVVLASRKYALDLLSLKFDIGCNSQQIIEIPQLNENELLIASQNYPNLNSLLENEKIKQLLQCPKYLDFALRTIEKAKNDLSNLCVTDFKHLLWNALVVDVQNTKNGLHINREKAFMNIAVKRAKEMKLFTKPDDAIDADALVCLENDEIVFQENTNRRYSPTHDILEDWALERYVSEMFEEYSNPEDFFVNLGNEPAIRRAFRLWVEDYLIDNNDKLVELIRVLLYDNTIERYWSDELLISVFRSDNCAYFFEAFEKDLLLDNGTFFNKCLHVIKTCSKEMIVIGDTTRLIPIGNGWSCALSFINKHIEQLNNKRLSILTFMSDWYKKLLFKYNDVNEEEKKNAKSIVLYYIKEFEFGILALEDIKLDFLVSILFDLSSVSKEDIESLIDRCCDNKEKLWTLKALYKVVKKRILSGIGNFHFLRDFPEIVVKFAWKEWRYYLREDGNDDIIPHRLYENECWGIKNGNFFPSGIYKTPFYNLLKIHPIEGIKFIVEFVNYAVDFYTNTYGNNYYKHNITKIDIVVYDNRISSIYASEELWLAFRGHSVTSYLLESLLMSLEKYLLEVAANNSDTSSTILDYMFEYILENSNNVAPIAVLSSIIMAYPIKVGKKMLPIFSVKEFYTWDLTRALKDHSPLAPIDFEIVIAQEERYNSNQLLHRRKYSRGLLDFVLDYQFNIRILNDDLFKIFDVLKEKYDNSEDIVWKKNLIEIDIRNQKIGEYDPKLGGFPIYTIYDEEIDDYFEDNKEEEFRYQEASKYAALLTKAWESNDIINYEEWKECYIYYTRINESDVLHTMKILDRPITLAYIGLDSFSNLLSSEQKNWCVEKLNESIIDIIDDTYHHGFGMSVKYNLLEKDVALSSFHLLISNTNNGDEKDIIIRRMIFMLTAPFSNFDIDIITKYIREVFYKYYPILTKRIWLILIELSIYRKNIGSDLHCKSESQFKDEIDFIDSKLSENNINTDLSKISFAKCDKFILSRLIPLTPIHFEDSDFCNFILHILSLLLDDMKKEENMRILTYDDYEMIIYIKRYLALCLLDSDTNFSIPLFKLLIESVLEHEPVFVYGRDDLLEFINGTLDFYVLKLHDNGILKVPEETYKKEIDNFWSLWKVFYNLVPDNSDHPIIKKLLFDINYLLYDDKGIPNDENWNVFEQKIIFYRDALIVKGKSHISSAIKVLSTIGDKAFMPYGVHWIVDILKSNIEQQSCLESPDAERMIHNLYKNHIYIIKSDKKLIDDYLWILNKMVELGSSKAYFIRENVITYKNNK